MSDALIIDTLGGPSAVAKICEVRPQAVSQWKKTGIPKARLMYLKVAYPEIFECGPEEVRQKVDAA